MDCHSENININEVDIYSIYDDDEYYNYEYEEPEFYLCMCCGNSQQNDGTCKKCSGPVFGQH